MDEIANTRWSRFGPYYAMFPVDFAFNVIREHSSANGRVLDPFAGRGTSIYAATALGRDAVGIEINPVGWVYGKTKLKPAKEKVVLNRLADIADSARNYSDETEGLPEFFSVCFCPEVLNFLLAAKSRLNWRGNNVDRTLIAFILYYLHNNIGQGLSNQMKQTIAMSPSYSLRWWRANGYATPPQINPQTLLAKKIKWRYEKGVPQICAAGEMLLGDSERQLDKVKRPTCSRERFSLLLTSPPYCSVVNYYTDQWLRLWVLGGAPLPKKTGERSKGRFHGKEEYCRLLHNVFSKCAQLMRPGGTVYVRTDIRKFTFESTKKVLRECFPKHNRKIKHSKPKRSQSQLYKNDPLIRPGECDIILTR